MWDRMKGLLMFALLGSEMMVWASSHNEKNQGGSRGVYENEYHIPFPVQRGGEEIDVLVHVKDSRRAYQLNLILVYMRDWPEEKSEKLMRLYDGFSLKDDIPTPFPFKFRIRIDSADDRSSVHVDQVASERYRLYGGIAENGAATWRALKIYSSVFRPGVYRVRIDNLVAVPDIDFKTLIAFERDSRKY